MELNTYNEANSKAEFLKDPSRCVMLPAHARLRHSVLLEKQDEMEALLKDAPWNRLKLGGDLGIIASGISGLYAEEAIAQLGADVSFLRIGTFPPPGELISKLLCHVKSVLVIEELEPVLEEYVERSARVHNPDVEILGKGTGHLSREGEFDPLMVRNVIASMMGLPAKKAAYPKEAGEILPPRPPAMCPGCSHRATYYAMKKAFGKDAIFPSDIGCYTMAVPMGTVETCLCMGGSITLASGIRFGGVEKDICCSLGDSTFLHAGMTGLLNAAYNKARITVTILDNSTTAMTGHQPHPGTGLTVTGAPTVVVDMESLATALGAGYVKTVDPYDLDAAIETFTEAKEYPGLSVVIAKQACVISAMREGIRRKPLVVNENCAGCKICVKFGCPAIEFEDEVAKINAFCSGCGVCAHICPSDAIEVAE